MWAAYHARALSFENNTNIGGYGGDKAGRGSLAPAGTPQPIIDKLSQAVQAAYRKPALRKKIADTVVEAASSTPEELSDLIRKDTELWGRVVKAGKLLIN